MDTCKYSIHNVSKNLPNVACPLMLAQIKYNGQTKIPEGFPCLDYEKSKGCPVSLRCDKMERDEQHLKDYGQMMLDLKVADVAKKTGKTVDEVEREYDDYHSK